MKRPPEGRDPPPLSLAPHFLVPSMRKGSEAHLTPAVALSSPSATVSSLRPHAVYHIYSTCVMFCWLVIIRSLLEHASSGYELKTEAGM